MVYIGHCSFTTAVSCGTSHASAVSTPLRWIFKKLAIKLATHVEPHASAVSLLKRAENSGIKAIINQSISSSCSSSSGSSSSSSSSVCVCVLSDLTQVRLYCPDWELTTLSTRSSLTPASLSGDTGYRTVSIPSIGVPVQSAEGSVVSHIVFHVQFPCSISTGVCQHISCSTCSFPAQSA